MITKLSPAKVNLTLDVKSKEAGADFHELETIYHLVNWGDQLSVEVSDKFELHGDFDCAMEGNLIYKAWQLIEDPKPIKVCVEKNIPTGAGLGGGSSNAATFVLAYFELFTLGAVPDELISKLGALGKDIPFFFTQEPCALGTHYGEITEPLGFNFSGQMIYLYLPGTKSPTPQAYAQLKHFDTQYTQTFLETPKLEGCGNTFEQIFEQKKYSTTHLSGSGSSWFSFEKLDIPEWKVVETTLL